MIQYNNMPRNYDWYTSTSVYLEVTENLIFKVFQDTWEPCDWSIQWWSLTCYTPATSSRCWGTRGVADRTTKQQSRCDCLTWTCVRTAPNTHTHAHTGTWTHTTLRRTHTVLRVSRVTEPGKLTGLLTQVGWGHSYHREQWQDAKTRR